MRVVVGQHEGVDWVLPSTIKRAREAMHCSHYAGGSCPLTRYSLLLSCVALQVPEPFLEEFPHTLYAADVRHRRAVSLGRHVVCRASLGTLSEHQLVGLSTMAKGQLVALCSLQTAELHLVPYFDNKNLVRMVGFLKIKSE